MGILNILLLPLSLIYGLGVSLIRLLYRYKILRSHQFQVPIIVVGNLTAGGTGKTPHVEYLIRLLADKYRIAILSRGYRRKTRGFVLGGKYSTSEILGDEPMQLSSKFENLIVAVDENRPRGIRNLLERYPQLNAILLDDAFQHYALKPGLSILLTDYYNLYTDDYLLPVGRLREMKSAAARADIIVVTKCPEILSTLIRRHLLDILRPKPYQTLFFSYIKYGDIIPIFSANCQPRKSKKYNTILLFAGIANTYPLEDYLRKQCVELITLKFSDHHEYTPRDIQRISTAWEEIFTRNKLLITTEKDVMRLKSKGIQELIVHLPLHYIPIEIEFHAGDKERFDQKILNYVASHQPDR